MKMVKFVLAFWTSIVAFAVSAEIVARALVTQEQGSVWLYDIDENGAWAQSRKIVDDYDKTCTHPNNAAYRNGVVYVTDYSQCAIFKYDLAGEYLGKIETPGFASKWLAVTSDGATLFVGAETNIVKISTVSNEISEFYAFGKGSLLRDMATDNSGRLYVADRGKNKLHIFNYLAEEGALEPTSVDFNFCEGVGWDPSANLVYVAGNDKQWGIFYPDGSVHTPLMESESQSGWCTGVSCIGGTMYYESYSNKKLYRLDVENNMFIEVPTVVHNNTFKGADVSAVVIDTFSSANWKMDEANGSASSADGSGQISLTFAGGVRMAANGDCGNCAFFASGGSYMALDKGSDMVPPTGDFAVFFRVGLPAVSEGGSPRHLFSNAIGADGDFAVLADVGGSANTIGLEFTPVGSAERIEIVTATTVADGGWHHVGVVRHDGRLELWMDGERLAFADVPAEAEIAAAREWRFGCSGNGYFGYVGSGAFYDDIVFTSEPPSAKYDIIRYFETNEKSLTAPELPNAPLAQAMPQALGVEIAHVFANEGVVSMPSILIAADGSYYVSCDHGNGPCDPSRSTTVYRSVDRGETWQKKAELNGHSVSLFEQEGVLCAVGLKAGLGYPASMRTVTVWTNANEGAFLEAASLALPVDCKMLPSPVFVGPVPDGRTCLVLALSANDGGVLRSAWVRFDVSGSTFANGEFKINSDRGFVRQDKVDVSCRTFADVMGGIVIPKNVNFVSMYPVIDRKTTLPEVLVGSERVAYQNVLGNGNWSRFRFNLFRGGSKPFNVRKDDVSRMYYAVTVPSVNSEELSNAYADEIVGRLALYASPDPEYMAWYPCGLLDASEEYGFTAPAFAFDGDDLIVACAVSAFDGFGARSRSAANYLSFRRFPAFRASHAVQMPSKDNRTRAFVVADTFIMKYYRTSDGEWQSDGVLVNDTQSLMRYSAPCFLKVRGKKIFVLNYDSSNFCALDLNGKVVASYTGPVNGKIKGIDVSEDGSRALLACGAGGVWECNLSDNSLVQLAEIGADLVDARDVAILPDGGFLVTNYKWGDYYTLRYDASSSASRLPMRNSYFTSVTLAPDGNTAYVGKVYGSVWRVNLLDNSYSLIRNDLAGSPFNVTYAISCGADKVWFVSQTGFVTAYDPKDGSMSAPFAHFDYPTSGIAFYEYAKPGSVITLR